MASDHVTVPNGRRPPSQAIRREYTGSEDRELDTGGGDQPLEMRVQRCHGIRLLEERVRY
jgi:hypothetical protein